MTICECRVGTKDLSMCCDAKVVLVVLVVCNEQPTNNSSKQQTTQYASLSRRMNRITLYYYLFLAQITIPYRHASLSSLYMLTYIMTRLLLQFLVQTFSLCMYLPYIYFLLFFILVLLFHHAKPGVNGPSKQPSSSSFVSGAAPAFLLVTY